MKDFRNTILFTGAGFTANFGGFLGTEMWSKIFNNPKLNAAGNVKRELKDNFNFETVYSKVIDDRGYFPSGEVKLFEEAVDDAYEAMDGVIKQDVLKAFGISLDHVRKFLNNFTVEQEGKIGVCFTLNQDLFLERHLDWKPLAPHSKYLPTPEELNLYKTKISDEFSYIKLHGSSGWVAADGNHSKIIGINKPDAIDKIPLLKWYFELFEQALYRPNTKLVIIGYGFRDPHINTRLLKAINEYGLKLYIVSPEDPSKFRFRIKNKYPPESIANDQNSDGTALWQAIEGYFPYTLKRIFPASPYITSAEIFELYKALDFTV